MTTTQNDFSAVPGQLQVGVTGPERQHRRATDPAKRGQWWRLVLVVIITAIVVTPIVSVVILSLQPGQGSNASGLTLSNFSYVFQQTDLVDWLENSALIACVTVVVCVIIASPAGYVLSRGRNRWVSSYALILFVVQSLPVVTAVIPLFILFSKLNLVDNLAGVMVIYVGSTMSVAIWMMAAYFDSIPISLEEAAWIDGASVFGSFARVVLRNSLPGVLSTAIFAFLLAWNEYLVALVFLKSSVNYTLVVGLNTFFQQNATNWGAVMAVAVVMMIPPIVVFALLNRYFSVGGIGGSLAGR